MLWEYLWSTLWCLQRHWFRVAHSAIDQEKTRCFYLGIGLNTHPASLLWWSKRSLLTLYIKLYCNQKSQEMYAFWTSMYVTVKSREHVITLLRNILIQGWGSGMTLRVLTVPLKDQLWVPSTHSRQHATSSNSSCRGWNTLLASPGTCIHTGILIHTNIQTQKQNIN